jgi:microcompartment protein CcmL/EutN
MTVAPDEPALALLEIADAPSGLVALDALAKEAPVVVVAAGTVQSGRWLIAFAGDVESVERSFARGSERAKAALVDAVLLHFAEPRILPALRDGKARGRVLTAGGDSLAVLQTSTSPTLLRAVDAALKGAAVELVELRLAEGLAGRGLATLWGAQTDVEAAIDEATAAFGRGLREGCVASIVANADPEIARAVGAGTRFFKEPVFREGG